MIKNIVFDLGNVLIYFDPKRFLKDKGFSSEEIAFIHQEIYCSHEWVDLDLGVITREEAKNRILLRNAERAELLDASFFVDELLTPIAENIALLARLKPKYSLYYLTNYHKEAFRYTHNRYSFFNHFTGGVVSADVNLIKPDPAIYTTLLERYALNRKETLYIDDLEKNAAAAASLGMEAIHLEKPEYLRTQLQKKGIEIKGNANLSIAEGK